MHVEMFGHQFGQRSMQTASKNFFHDQQRIGTTNLLFHDHKSSGLTSTHAAIPAIANFVDNM